MAGTWIEEPFPERSETLEFMDAAESDGDQQLEPILVDDTPGVGWGTVVSIAVSFASLVTSSHLTLPEKISLDCLLVPFFFFFFFFKCEETSKPDDR